MNECKYRSKIIFGKIYLMYLKKFYDGICFCSLLYFKNNGLKALEFINNGRTYNGNRPYPKMTGNFFHF